MHDSSKPSRATLIAVATFADYFDAPGFVAGEWVQPEPSQAGAIALGYWCPCPVVSEWNRALYEHGIIDFDCDYLSDETAEFVRRAIEDPTLIADLDLPTLRRVLTFLARAERHSEGGWYEPAFASGMAQLATRRLGEIADSTT